ncbi:hypothetical protein FQ085_01895 [Planococcus sp. ANT_H30]|nr:hypothetical protein FQ085_01895 [Planococcus sp. ANT_H30]
MDVLCCCFLLLICSDRLIFIFLLNCGRIRFRTYYWLIFLLFFVYVFGVILFFVFILCFIFFCRHFFFFLI